MGFTAENPGVLTTIQDEGRYGYEQFGMSPAGPMDQNAFRTANLLVGNPMGESALEATVLGPTLRFDADNVVAVTGADMGPALNGQPCPMYQAVAVKAGDQLKLGAAKTGCRAYIAFAGGLDVPQVMGSRATALQNQVGGYQGRKLAKGDRIGFRAPNPRLPLPRTAPVPAPAGKEAVIRVILGPTSGQPIIMLAERQTVGGYTKIATVISADLPLVGQRKTGDVIRFQAVSVEEAHRLWRESAQALEALKTRLDQPQSPPAPVPAQAVGTAYRVTVNGRSYQVQVVRHTG